VIEVAFLVEHVGKADVIGEGTRSLILPYLCLHDYYDILPFNKYMPES